MNQDKKDVIDNPAMPSWYKAEVTRNRKFYRLFWPGFFVVIPIAFIFRHNIHTVRIVSQYYILYGLSLFIVELVYRKSKGIALGVPLEPSVENSLVVKMYRNSTVLFLGVVLGYVTFNLIFSFIV